MQERRDIVPPGHGEPESGGAIPEGETLALGLPPLPPPIADLVGACPNCWYRHKPTEECPSWRL